MWYILDIMSCSSYHVARAIKSFWVECHCPLKAKFLGREYNTVIETGQQQQQQQQTLFALVLTFLIYLTDTHAHLMDHLFQNATH